MISIDEFNKNVPPPEFFEECKRIRKHYFRNEKGELMDKKTITVELTEAQEKFLKKFAENHYEGSPNNHCTSMPLFVVQKATDRVVNEEYETADGQKYIYTEDPSYQFDTPDEVVKEYISDNDLTTIFISYEDAVGKLLTSVEGEEIIVASAQDYLNLYGVDDEYCELISYKADWEDVAYFFIEEEAKRYQDYQSHNLGKSRVYTKSMGYSNYGEYASFWKLLMKMGKILNNEETKEGEVTLAVPEGPDVVTLND